MSLNDYSTLMQELGDGNGSNTIVIQHVLTLGLSEKTLERLATAFLEWSKSLQRISYALAACGILYGTARLIESLRNNKNTHKRLE